ncbi:hypothetical protein [Cellulosilyticum sp. I15G10I2]|uniref:hypothetical protein n=1 Tax=Cellulosilyticum sp. I15G10I2 TaxID=1892843 RepID=UPI00085C2C4C|nr:hypothetical protein [Cellulosilyticum sp. I15G10I2]
MQIRGREFPLTFEEVRDLIKKENSNKAIWITIAVSVILVLVAIVIWLAKKSCKDIEEHYEYFDDDYDEAEDYEDFDEYDDSIYEDEEVEYVKIKDFMNYSEDEKGVEPQTEESVESDESTSKESDVQNQE